MSDIVLSASVRQNLLSLQSTAALLATTQERLATGKKVNTALDNPTNYFTAQALDNRAGDINNLLDGIGNGVQVLQAANTGLTSLQQLVDSAKSVANQVLQSTTGYTTRSSVTAVAIPGATPQNLLGATTTTATAATVTGSSVSGLAATETLSTAGFTNGESFTVNGKTISFVTGAAGDAAFTDDGSGNLSISLSSTAGGTVQSVLDAIDQVTGGTSSITGGQLTITAANTTDHIVLADGAGSPLGSLGLTATDTAPGSTTTGGISGQTLTIASTAGGTATNITFGTGQGQVSTLNQLNAALIANNLQASIDPSGAITISTTNDAASATMGAIGGSAAATGNVFAGLAGGAPVADPTSQQARAGLVAQYNNIIANINSTAQDASFNGINLLNGDTLKLIFNETGKSVLNINGSVTDAAGLGLEPLTQGTDFIDSNSANKVLTSLNNASSQLRTEAATLGSNLSIVEIRQDFSKNLINVLQTGSSNLTLADTNEEAANSQALSTRQSIAVSALALANQSQQSVLQLLR